MHPVDPDPVHLFFRSKIFKDFFVTFCLENLICFKHISA